MTKPLEPEGNGKRIEDGSLGGAVERRRVLKAAGVGLAATAAALTAGKAFAQEVAMPVGQERSSQPPIPDPIRKPIQDLICEEGPKTDQYCGALPPPVQGVNQVEIVVPAGREVLVRRLKEGEQPLAEVLVRISEDIRLRARNILVATASPTPMPSD